MNEGSGHGVVGAERAPPLLIAGWLLLALSTVYVVLVGGAYHGIAQTPQRILNHVVAAVCLGAWAVTAVRVPQLRPMPPIVLGALPALATFGIAVVASQRPRLSLEAGIDGLALWVTLLAALGLARLPELRKRFAALLIVLAAVIAFGYVVQVIYQWLTWWDLAGRVSVPPLRPVFSGLTLGSPNLIATYLILLGPLAAVLTARRFGILASAVLVVAMLAATFLSGSRGGWLGAGIAFIVLAMLSVGPRLGPRLLGLIGSGRRRVFRLSLAAAVVLPVAGLGLRLAAARLDLADDLRSTFWRSAWNQFLDHPLTGVGPGTWPQLHFETGSTDEFAIAVAHAHNTVLHTLAEVGLLGALGISVLVAVVAWRLVVVLRSGTAASSGAAAAIASLGGLAGQSTVDHLLNLPAVVLLCVFVIAWVDGDPDAPRASVANVRRDVATRLSEVAAVVSVGLLAAAGPTVLAFDRASVNLVEANAAADQRNWAQALAGYEAAFALDPESSLHGLLRANALAHVGRTTEALEGYRLAAPIDLLPENIVALAVLEAAVGNSAVAAEHAGNALRIGGATPTVALNAGLVLESAGDTSGAMEAYSLAARTEPALLASSFWDARPVGLRRDAVRDRVATYFESVGAWQEAALVAAYGDDADRAAEDIALAQPTSERNAVAAAVDWIAGRPGAIERLEATLSEDPTDFYAAAWLARILEVEGKSAEAARYRAWATVLRADQVGNLVWQLSVVPAPANERWRGRPILYPDTVYLRTGPLDPLPPEVLVIGAERGNAAEPET